MKHLRVILAILIALAVTGVGAPSGSAAEPITGTILHQTASGYVDPGTGLWVDAVYGPLAGVKVNAHVPSRNGTPSPKVSSSVTTGENGEFSLSVGSGPVCIRVEAPALWQSGWVYDAVTDSEYPFTGTYFAAPEACQIMPGDWLGTVVLLSSMATGQVINQDGDPIRGATVRYSPYDFSGRTWSATTDAQGFYTISGLDYEEFEVKVSARKYLSGWVSSTGDVVATFGEAFTVSPGPISTPDSQIRMTLK